MAKASTFSPFQSAAAKSAFSTRVILTGVACLLPFVLLYFGIFISAFASAGFQKGSTAPAAPPVLMIVLMIFLYVWLLAEPWILATFLHKFMQQYRVPLKKLAGKNIQLATLKQRGLAMLIDQLITIIPSALVGIASGILLALLRPLEKNSFPWQIFAAVAIAFLCALVIRLILTWQEGQTGYTPGRKAMKIKLLTLNLKPCGFGLSLLRSLIMLVDSFFIYTVGLYFMAYTEKQQRVGDLAAGTVVVDTK